MNSVDPESLLLEIGAPYWNDATWGSLPVDRPRGRCVDASRWSSGMLGPDRDEANTFAVISSPQAHTSQKETSHEERAGHGQGCQDVTEL